MVLYQSHNSIVSRKTSSLDSVFPDVIQKCAIYYNASLPLLSLFPLSGELREELCASLMAQESPSHCAIRHIHPCSYHPFPFYDLRTFYSYWGENSYSLFFQIRSAHFVVLLLVYSYNLKQWPLVGGPVHVGLRARIT
jgi:hypothetical protein